MRLILAAQSGADRNNLTPTSERLVNCYAVPAPDGALAPLVIRSVPPTQGFVELPGPFLRAMARVEDRLYVVCGGALYLVRGNGTFTMIDAIPDDVETAMVGHREKVTIAAGGSYFVRSGAGIVQPGDGTILNVGSVAFLDQFTLLGDGDGRLVEWTEVADPEDRNGLHFATAEARDDKIVRIVETGAYVAVLKRHSVELWGNTGLGGAAAFQRIGGAVLDRGAMGFNLITTTPDGVFYVGEDSCAYLYTGGAPVQVSQPHVVQAIKAGDPTHAFYYEDRGHRLHVIRFGDRPAWVYDAATGLWHERASGTSHGPWDIISAVYVYDRWHLGDRKGQVYRLGDNAADADAPLRRTIVSRPLHNEGSRFVVSRLEIDGLFGNYSVSEPAPNFVTDQFGVVLTDQYGDPIIPHGDSDGSAIHPTAKRPGRIWIRISRDGGHTFGEPKIKNIGRLGEYEVKVDWRSLGQFDRHMTVEINVTDPVDVPLLSEAIVEAS